MTPIMTDYEFGDVVVVPFPFSDLGTTKRRPAVVASSAAYNRIRPDLIILAITTHWGPSQSTLEVPIIHWNEAGLLKRSLFKPVLTTITKSLVARKLGRLAEADQQALRKLLNDVLG